jgi:iron complex outermembrane receptor protein
VPFAGPPPTQTGCLFLTTDRFEREFSATTKSASVQYRVNPQLMTYLSWSEGFKSGGFNQRYNAAPPGNAPISFNPETAESWEVGFKMDPADTVRLNVALFTTDYDDIQMTYRLGVVPLAVQRGRGLHHGGELELEFAPTAEFRSMAASAISGRNSTRSRHRRRSDPVTPTATATLKSRLPFTPEWQGAPGSCRMTSVSVRAGNSRRARTSASAEQQFFDAGNSREIAQLEGITLVNASLTLASDDSKWRFALTGNNLTNEEYPVAGTSSLTTASGYAEIIYSRPRTVALSATFNF